MTYLNAKKIVIRTYLQVRIVNIESIVYCRAIGRFANIAIDENEEFISRHSLKELEKMISEDFFIRCHKCLIVNMKHVKSFDLGCNELILFNDVNLKVSRGKAKLIRQYFEKQ